MWDTETTETSHKGETKDVYDVTSKRIDSYEIEMIKKNMNSHYLDFQTTLMGIRVHGKSFIRKEKTEFMEFSILNNLSYYKFMRRYDKVLGFRTSCRGHHWLDLDTVLNCNIVLSDMNDAYVNSCPDSDLTSDNIATTALTMPRIWGIDHAAVEWNEDSDSDMDTPMDRHIKRDTFYYIYPGVKYVPNDESLMEKGTFYATNSYGNSQHVEKYARYDFIMVALKETITDEQGEEKEIDVLCPAKLLAIFGTDKSNVKFYVQYMNEIVTSTEKKTYPFQEYGWHIIRYTGNRQAVFLRDFIDLEAVAGPAYIFPKYSMKHSINFRTFHKKDRFYLIQRAYLDRWGWKDVVMKDVEQNNHIEPKDIDEYLLENINLPLDSAEYRVEMEKLRRLNVSEDIEYSQEGAEDGDFDD